MRADGTSAQGNRGHVGGLDSVRLVCALVVVFGHIGGPPLLDGVNRASRLGWALHAAYGNLFAGPAAVIVFFVISGFCIHYPYRDAEIPYLSYYARRYFRILMPMAAAVALGTALGVKLTLLADSILWSLLAEEIYYLIYPLLRQLRKRVSFRVMIAVAFGLAYLVVLRDPRAGNYASYGAGLNWVVGLPCWLLGCELAEVAAQPRPAPSRVTIWLWRAAVWALASLCSVLRFHTTLTYPWTLNPFALVATLWLVREIAYRRQFPAPAALERGGRWSYSIYLVHLQGVAVFGLLHLPFREKFVTWFLELGITLGVCYAFARLIEFPSHRLARRIGARLLVPAKPLATAQD
jgi:peptidoglycan/LPS O-acetylase OafA/YrhL